MFKNEFQGGPYFEILSSGGRAPASQWRLTNVNKEFSRDVKSFVYVVEGTGNTGLQLPKSASTKAELFLVQPVLVLQILVPAGATFSLDLSVTGMDGMHRRLHLSTAQRAPKIAPLHSRLPLPIRTRAVWTNLCIDLASITSSCFKGITFRSVDSISIGTTCKLRKVFTLRSVPFDSVNGDRGASGCEDIPAKVNFPLEAGATTQVLQSEDVVTEESIAEAPASGMGLAVTGQGRKKSIRRSVSQGRLPDRLPSQGAGAADKSANALRQTAPAAAVAGAAGTNGASAAASASGSGQRRAGQARSAPTSRPRRPISARFLSPPTPSDLPGDGSSGPQRVSNGTGYEPPPGSSSLFVFSTKPRTPPAPSSSRGSVKSDPDFAESTQAPSTVHGSSDFVDDSDDSDNAPDSGLDNTSPSTSSTHTRPTSGRGDVAVALVSRPAPGGSPSSTVSSRPRQPRRSSGHGAAGGGKDYNPSAYQSPPGAAAAAPAAAAVAPAAATSTPSTAAGVAALDLSEFQVADDAFMENDDWRYMADSSDEDSEPEEAADDAVVGQRRRTDQNDIVERNHRHLRRTPRSRGSGSSGGHLGSVPAITTTGAGSPGPPPGRRRSDQRPSLGYSDSLSSNATPSPNATPRASVSSGPGLATPRGSVVDIRKSVALARAALDEQAERNVMRLSRISMGSSGDESGDLSFGLSYARSPSFANTQTPVPQINLPPTHRESSFIDFGEHDEIRQSAFSPPLQLPSAKRNNRDDVFVFGTSRGEGDGESEADVDSEEVFGESPPRIVPGFNDLDQSTSSLGSSFARSGRRSSGCGPMPGVLDEEGDLPAAAAAAASPDDGEEDELLSDLDSFDDADIAAGVAGSHDHDHDHDHEHDHEHDVAEASQAPTSELNLKYDPVLNCYFDPVTNQYYELT